MKKKYILFLIVIIIPVFCFFVYYSISFLDYKSSLSRLEEYVFLDNEKTIMNFQYKNKDYVVSRYYDDSSSWSHFNILLKDNKKYYLLKNIKKCDISDDLSNLYLDENKIYIHCIGKEGNVDKYTINDFVILEEKLIFDFKNTPNISQLHIGIDYVDNGYIYLSSPFKVDNRISSNPKVKCSLENKKCSYIE